MRRAALAIAGFALAVAAVALGTGALETGAANGSGGAVVAPTWDDVAPVFAAKCAGCHQSGGVAPFSLTSPLEAKAYAPAILQKTQSGQMPPWMPGSDSPPILGQSRRLLTPDEKFLIASWVRGGAKLGSAKKLAAPRPSSAARGTTLALTPRRAYLPRATAGGTDDYHCMLLDPKLSQDMFVTSAVVKPQQRELVHHVILFEATGANAAEARRLDAGSRGAGWTCFGGPQLAETRGGGGSSDTLGSPQWISAWVPGHATNDLPSGTGVLLHRGAVVVMQVHYNLLHAGHRHQARPDRSRVVLKLAPAAGSTLTPLRTFLVPAPVELPCAAGVSGPLCTRRAAFRAEAKKYGQDAAYISVGLLLLCNRQATPSLTTSCDRTFDRPVRIYGVAGHMHLRGVDIRLELNPGTAGAQTLLHIPRWDFHWQDAYYLERPVDAAAGDTIRVSCRFDNRGSKRYILWGEGTTDEMCLGLLQIADARR